MQHTSATAPATGGGYDTSSDAAGMAADMKAFSEEQLRQQMEINKINQVLTTEKDAAHIGPH